MPKLKKPAPYILKSFQPLHVYSMCPTNIFMRCRLHGKVYLWCESRDRHKRCAEEVKREKEWFACGRLLDVKT